MNISHHIFPMLIFVFGIGACREKSQVPKSESPSLMILSVSYGTDPAAVKWYEYNDRGDLVRQGMDVDTLIYNYAEHKIVKSHLNKKLTWDAKTEYTKDAVGRIINSIIYDEKDQVVSRFQYVYNDQGYLVKTIQKTLATNAQYTNEFVYESANLQEVKTYDAQGNHDSRYVYQYYKDIPNVLNMNLNQVFDEMIPNERLGKMNKNMVSQLANISKEGDTLSLVKYKYQMPKGDSILMCNQSDVLNEFDTDVIYQLKKR
jgi:hypothetical protein